jgi:phytanoyl-CoA hydroxylase
MPILTPEEALRKRDELIELGYAIIPGVLQNPLLDELRAWSHDVFERLPVDPKYRYQGSDIHVSTKRLWKTQLNPQADEKHFADPIVEKIIDYPAQLEACRLLQLEGLVSRDNIILLSKPAYGPPLYWHQDYMNWNSPAAATPWPTVIFLSYYLSDTSRENGCLRVIPGSHRKRTNLHDILPDAHGPDIQAIDDLDSPVFMDHPDAIDVPLKAGDLIIADARLLHAAWPNQTAQRRTLVLAWHGVFPFPEPPSWWKGPIPDVVKNADPDIAYEGTRKPSDYLR